MKRLVSFFMALLFVFCVGISPAAAADSSRDYSSLSLEELISMRASLDAEIDKRVSDYSTTLLPGSYIVGRDIEAGPYILLGLMDEGPTGYTPQVLIAESEEDAEYSEYIDYKYMETGSKWYITVTAGNVIIVRYGDVAIQNASPLTYGMEDTNPNDPTLSATSTIVPGRYVTGKDIKAGIYVLVGLMDEGPTGYTPQALIAESIDDATNSDYIDYQYLETDEIWRITLQPGNVLVIRYGDVAVQNVEPLAFAPDAVPEEPSSMTIDDGLDEYGIPVIKGIYLAGRDIEPGSYNIKMTDCKQSTVIATFANNEDLSAYISWDSANNLGQYSKTAVYVNKNQRIHIYLEDGDYLYIGDGSGVLFETDNSTLVKGVYHVGKELAAGSYFITLTDFHNTAVVATFANSSDLASYVSWDSSNNLKQYSTVCIYVNQNETFHISLAEGEFLYIADGIGTYEAR